MGRRPRTNCGRRGRCRGEGGGGGGGGGTAPAAPPDKGGGRLRRPEPTSPRRWPPAGRPSQDRLAAARPMGERGRNSHDLLSTISWATLDTWLPVYVRT